MTNTIGTIIKIRNQNLKKRKERQSERGKDRKKRELTLEHPYSENSGQDNNETANRPSRSSQHGCHILQLHFTNNKTDIFVSIYLSLESL